MSEDPTLVSIQKIKQRNPATVYAESVKEKILIRLETTVRKEEDTKVTNDDRNEFCSTAKYAVKNLSHKGSCQKYPLYLWG